MRPHPRIRKTIKWGGSVVVCVMTTTWWASTIWETSFVNRAGFAIQLTVGRLHVHWFDTARYGFIWTGWKLEIQELDTQWKPALFFHPVHTELAVPLWLPLLAFLSASALAWRLDTLATRRAKLGACPTCSYPRTGLAPSAPCPECSKPGEHAS